MIGLECLLATVGILERSDVIRAFPKRFTSSCNFARSGKGLKVVLEYVLKLAPVPISDTGELEHNLEIQKEGIDNAPIYRDFNIHFNLFNVEYHNI